MFPRDVLVSTNWLAERLGDARMRVVDVRWAPDDAGYGERAYARGHVPGAVYIGARARVATLEQFRQSMEEAGAHDAATVVAYDDGGPFRAARLVWGLHYLGHPAAHVLDGGFRKWLREARPIETETATRPHGLFTPVPRAGVRATKETILRLLSDPGDVQIVDCRRDESWEAARQHIPGARHLPSSAAFTAEGSWRSPDELRQVAAAAGVALDRPTVLYCGGGVSAACVYVMLKMLGAEEVAVYDASWREWVSDPTTPKEPH